MKKHGLSAISIYFLVLFVIVMYSVIFYIDIINIVYMIVVLCSSLKLNLIVNEYKK